ncbi:hypothetical protein [Parvularcula lutaonensis]|uniref:Yip1 domain-containing protein n=1 Tax=Parvularcula lutaonensis TaxID=491923 RepID=A0ABV7MDI7_9PROT|nr:hypothetical protein [Parvularcula lutaonensis]GGY52627.1 hypothetical protein GCM10007148_22290 [Parvularcula lutaonensis]
MSETALKAPHQLGLDSFVEDLFGLNIRGLGTIRDLLVRPKAVFEAARSPDWEERYTPSIRLVFSILTVMAFFSFIWAGDDSPMVQAMIEGLLASSDETGRTEQEAVDIANRIVALYAASIPFVYIICHGLVSLVVRVWGKGTPALVRMRLYMLSIVPSMTFSVLSLFLAPRFGESLLYLALSYLTAMALDAATAYRGGIVGSSSFRRVLKAVLFALVSFVTTAVASALAIAIPGIYVALQAS